ncbi:NAD(P)-binding domain-containing protein [Streptomyces sp. TP-A0356]|uniref:NAD(P)-binding domain-containing protein n=1 Tax=Streptomyces sp. TP-A0356 TaxID=1359208 RepID=UPI00131E85DC|nr:NAD(P)-binding domain-containing protein [Streptomyces sp. TP-A0356]
MSTTRPGHQARSTPETGRRSAGPAVGVLGAGRLGRALAARLAGRLTVAVSDAEASAADDLAHGLGVPAYGPAELAARCDVVLVCVPPPAVAAAIASCRGDAAGGGATVPKAVFANLATSVPTGRLREDPRLRDLTVVGLKPVCQYTAVAHGVPTVFVTSVAGQLPLLRAVVGELGTVLLGDETVEESVGAVNRIATMAALRACSALREELSGLVADPAVIASAVTNVFAGTAVDFPPDPANPYTAALLRELTAAGDHTGINSAGAAARSVGGAGHPAAHP